MNIVGPVKNVCLLALCGQLMGCGIPSFLVTPVQSTHGLKEEVVEEGHGWGAPKVAIIGVEGLLADAHTGGLLQPGENPLSLFTEELKQAETDDSVKAVVLRVNSPGGTVTTSDTMYQMVRRFKEKTHKPVIVSTQEVCASGAYYMSCAADKIVVHPTSLVGSVGVIFESFDVSDGLDKLGIHSVAVRSGPLKEMGSPFKHQTPQEREVMQQMVDEYFARFENVVSTSRHVTEVPPRATTLPASYAGIYSGRVFTGVKAVELGLADRTGLLQDAIDLARKMGNVPNAKAVLYKRPYGYGGSIYAQDSIPQPRANVIQLNLPGSQSLLPAGFYYLWQP